LQKLPLEIICEEERSVCEISLHFERRAKGPKNTVFATSPGNTCCSAEEKIFPGQGTNSARRSKKMKNEK